MKKFLFVLLALICSSQLWAQTRTITGKVTSAEDGSTLPGVSVVAKGSTTGTATDVDGKYRIEIPQDASTLVFSFVGFKTKEVAIGNNTVVDVQLTTGTVGLEEVVVVGYGTQDKRTLTGSVTSVKGEALKQIPVVSFQESLQGRAAGVQINSSSGLAGSGMTVRVRGVSSINASNQPLYVVDGVPINNGSNVPGGSTGGGYSTNFGQSTSPMADINPSDIESIEILKDAASAAIYGSRAANGVVIITTKKGQKGKAKFNFGAYTGFLNETRRIDMLNADEFVMLQNEALKNAPPSGNAPVFAVPNPRVDIDWVDQVLRTGQISQYDLSVGGGTENLRYFVSGTMFDQTGYLIGNRFQRYNVRANMEANVNKRLKIGYNLGFTRGINNRVPSDGLVAGLLTSAHLKAPITPIFNSDGKYDFANINLPVSSIATNVVGIAKLNDYKDNNFRTIGNMYADYQFTDHLSLRANMGIDWLLLQEFQYRSRFSNDGAAQFGRGGAYTTSDFNRLFEATLNYHRTIGDNHDITFLAGASYQGSRFEQVQAFADNYPSDELRTLASAASPITAYSAHSGWALTSFFARANYALKNKYLFALNARADGSSRFGANNRYGFFPSASVGWRISEEAFMANVAFVDDLKLRASVGVTGNSEISNFASRGLYGGSNYSGTSGLYPSQLANPDLKWETTTQYNVGVDVAVFKSRVSLTLDAYLKQTNGLLLRKPLPHTSGYESYNANIGAMENRGIEVGLNTVNVEGAFRWTTNFNIAFNKNEVTELVSDETPILGGTNQRFQVGQPANSFFLVRYQGVNPETGNPIWLDKEGKETSTYSTANRVFVGSALPKYTGGLTNTFTFKGLELSIFFQFVSGNKIYNSGNSFIMHPGNGRNQRAEMLNRWQKPGDITDVPRLTWQDVNGSTLASTRFLEDGSYLRLKTATLAYNFPSALLDKVKISGLKIYVRGQNLWTRTKYSGMDPEVSSGGLSNLTQGVDFLTPPQARTFTFGLNLGF